MNLRLDAEDLALLIACAKSEQLSRSDIIRRTVRAYAKQLGIQPETPKAA